MVFCNSIGSFAEVPYTGFLALSDGLSLSDGFSLPDGLALSDGFLQSWGFGYREGFADEAFNLVWPHRKQVSYAKQ